MTNYEKFLKGEMSPITYFMCDDIYNNNETAHLYSYRISYYKRKYSILVNTYAFTHVYIFLRYLKKNYPDWSEKHFLPYEIILSDIIKQTAEITVSKNHLISQLSLKKLNILLKDKQNKLAGLFIEEFKNDKL